MSQLEQLFRDYLAMHPEIERCIDLINRRKLARQLIRENVATPSQMEAMVAVLRRYPFKKIARPKALSDIRMRIKDRIMVLDLEKSKELVQDLRDVVAQAEYDKGETMKIVVGSTCVKLFIDEESLGKVLKLRKKHRFKGELKRISEFSLLFPPSAIDTKGIISWITEELLLNGIVIAEMLTATPELLIYVEDEYSVRAFEVLKRVTNRA